MESIQDPTSHSNPELFVTRHVDFDWTIDFDRKVVSGTAALHMVPLDLYIADRTAVVSTIAVQIPYYTVLITHFNYLRVAY